MGLLRNHGRFTRRFIYTWQWLYQHPDATVEDFESNHHHNAKTIWNKYYAPILGEENSLFWPSIRMIDIPLYPAPNYHTGISSNFKWKTKYEPKADEPEIQRIYPVGKLTPNWMQHAVGFDVSTTPLLEAAAKHSKPSTN